MMLGSTSPAAEICKTRKLLPFGPKANRFISRHPAFDAKINILEGSVRSGKTWSLTLKLLRWLCKYKVAGARIFTGVSKQAVYEHVLMDLFELVGEANYNYNRMSGELLLFGSKWLVIGAHDEGSEKRICGLTVGVCIGDEAVLMPRNFFLMLLSRMSPEGARGYFSTNPESPYHWLKTDVIDSQNYTHGLGQDVWSQRWLLTDNPNLDKKYVDFLDRSYVGVWHARYVEGLWVLAAGCIWRDQLTPDIFYKDGDRPADLLSRNGHTDHFVSVDVGTQNPQVYGEFYEQGGDVLWLQNEYYWDGRRENRSKSNGEYANDLINGDGNGWPGFSKDPREWPQVLVDPSAASFKVELINRGVMVTDGNNEVSDGIRRVASMLARKKLRIHEKCVGIRGDMETYSWDEKAAERGEEKPIKDHDHGCDLIRYAINPKISDWRLAA
jgi:PBSX family phage terminase large subunit